MDPLSHAACGRVLVALAPADRLSRAHVAAATLGALSPDLDAVFMPFGWDRYLRVHEIGTHTIPGTIACALLTGIVLHAFARRQPWTWLAAAAWLGAISHVLLDLVSSARLRVFWPFLDRQVSLPVVAMADPWLAGLLAAGVVALWRIRTRPERVAAATLAVTVGFLTLKTALGFRAVAAYEAAQQRESSPATARLVEARWGSVLEWNVFDRTRDHVRFWKATAGPRGARLQLAWPLPPESPALAASRSLSTVRNFLRVHHLGFAAVVPQADGGKHILWSDIRYCWNPSGAGAPQLEPRIVQEGVTLACALWFGGEFDRYDNALQQVVTIGGFTQSRPAGD
jgi:membrane-bound metal-dependent hydrolase YbcI (DUF457 family)